MASGEGAVEQESIAFVSTAVKEADFQTKCNGVTLHATEAVHIGFDGEPASSGSFLLAADTMFDFDVEFTKISALAVSTGGTLYILARR